MKLKIKRIDVWAAGITDQPGGLAEKLETLAKAKADLEFMIARRTPDKPGEGVVFLAPLKGGKVTKAAEEAGFRKADSMHSLRIEGNDKAGIGSKISRALADAGINVRGFSAAAIGKKFVAYLAVDSEADAEAAAKALKKI